MKTSNLDYDQLVVLKRMASDASTHAATMIHYWFDKSKEPIRVGGEDAVERAQAELKHWHEVEKKWWAVEDDVCARVRESKGEK